MSCKFGVRVIAASSLRKHGPIQQGRVARKLVDLSISRLVIKENQLAWPHQQGEGRQRYGRGNNACALLDQLLILTMFSVSVEDIVVHPKPGQEESD